MAAQLSELEAQLIAKRLQRLEAAKAELAKSVTPSIGLWALLVPLGSASMFGERLASYYGVSTQLFISLCILCGLVLFSGLQNFALSRKVEALTEIISSESQRE